MARVKYQNFAVDAAGNTTSSTQVEVRDVEGNLATLYEAQTGSTEAYSGSNPFNASDGSVDPAGYFEFWIEEGVYNIEVGSGSSAITYRKELISQDTVGTAVSDISGVDTRLTTAEGEIDTLQTDVSDLQALGAIGAEYTAGGPVAVATTANITLSGEQTIDGVTTSTDRILVKDQTAPEENGIYVTASSAWSRASDMDAAGEVAQTAVRVEGGTANGGKVFVTYSEVTALGTDAIDWADAGDFSGLQDQIDAINDAIGDSIFHDRDGGAPEFYSKLISAWTFDEPDGDTVYDRVGASNIDLTTPTNPNATRTAFGVRTESGLVQTPSITGAKQIVMLYKTGVDENTGFLISGGSTSGTGFLQENIGTTDTARYAGSGYGWHDVAARASTGAAAYELNRGGWGLLSRDMASSYNTIIGLGGRHSTTTSRCANFEIAMAFVFDTTLTTTEEDELLRWVRREAIKRGIYFHRDDCPVKQDVYIVAGESNADGRSTLTDLSAADQALDLSRFAQIMPGNGSTDWNRFDGFELGFNQQTTAPSVDFGPEFGVAFQRRDDAATIEAIARIIKLGKGTTYLAPSSTGIPSTSSWNVNELNTSGLFWRFLGHTQQAFQVMLSQGIGWDGVRVGFWIGLNDASDTVYTTDAATYQGYLQDVLDQIETELPGETVTFFLFRAHPSDPASDATALTHVRTASDDFGAANSNVTVEDTDALGLETDSVHYNAAASKAMGITLHG